MNYTICTECGDKHVCMACAFAECDGSKETRDRNDRDRAYDGQLHTSAGVRGKTMIEGLTMRDVRDCFIKAFLQSHG